MTLLEEEIPVRPWALPAWWFSVDKLVIIIFYRDGAFKSFLLYCVCVCALLFLSVSFYLLILFLFFFLSTPPNTRQCVYVINCSRTMSAQPKPIDNTGTFVTSHDRPVVFQRDCHRTPCCVYDSFHLPLSFSSHFVFNFLLLTACTIEPTAKFQQQDPWRSPSFQFKANNNVDKTYDYNWMWLPRGTHLLAHIRRSNVIY